MKRLLLFMVCALFSVEPAFAQQITSVRRASLSPQGNHQGASYSYDPGIDGTGRYIAFTSTADNFAAPGNDVGQFKEHSYLRDVIAGTTVQLDISADGQSGSPSNAFNTNLRTFSSSIDPHMSRDGKYVVFLSPASNISPDGQGETYGNWAYLKNIETGEIHRIPYATAGDSTKSEYPAHVTINGDGSIVVVISIISDVGDSNCSTCVWHITIYDRLANTTTILDPGLQGNKFNPSISDDGRYLVFENQTGDFSSTTYSYLWDRSLSELTPLNGGNPALSPNISGDGNFIAYADNSGVPETVVLLERQTGQTTLVSRGRDGSEANGISAFPSLDQSGRYLAFLSDASNLVAGDANGLDDIFVYDRVTGKMLLVSVQAACNSGLVSKEDFNTGPPSISSDGKTIVFTVLERLAAADLTDASGHVIAPADTNRWDDVYVATIDYDAKPPVFTKNLKPKAPFVSVNCTGTKARVQIGQIVTSGSGTSVKSVKKKALPKIKKLTQFLYVQTTNGRERGRTVSKTIAKKLQVDVGNLPPGNYAASVRVEARYSNGSVKLTKPGSPSKFTITNR